MCSECLSQALPSPGDLTFGYRRHLEGDADHTHQISQWNQGPQNGSDPDGFPLASVNQLQEENKETLESLCEVDAIILPTNLKYRIASKITCFYGYA